MNIGLINTELIQHEMWQKLQQHVKKQRK